MRRQIRLSVSDGLLFGALTLLLSEQGYQLTDDTSAPLITDDWRLCSEEENALYVGRERPNEETRYLHRPFEESALYEAVNGLFEDGESEKKSGIRIDKRRMVAYVDGTRIELTDRELKLLSLLSQRRGEAVSDGEIVERVFGAEIAENSNVAAVYINYLRKKLDQRLGRKLLYRVRGQGYMLK